MDHFASKHAPISCRKYVRYPDEMTAVMGSDSCKINTTKSNTEEEVAYAASPISNRMESLVSLAIEYCNCDSRRFHFDGLTTEAGQSVETTLISKVEYSTSQLRVTFVCLICRSTRVRVFLLRPGDDEANLLIRTTKGPD